MVKFTQGSNGRWYVSYGGTVVCDKRGYETRAQAVAAWHKAERKGGPRS